MIIDRILAPLLQRMPKLKVVLEHITTRHAAECVSAAPANVGATITAHLPCLSRGLSVGILSRFRCFPNQFPDTRRPSVADNTFLRYDRTLRELIRHSQSRCLPCGGRVSGGCDRRHKKFTGDYACTRKNVVTRLIGQELNAHLPRRLREWEL